MSHGGHGMPGGGAHDAADDAAQGGHPVVSELSVPTAHWQGRTRPFRAAVGSWPGTEGMLPMTPPEWDQWQS